jgi:CheY-like chemotaxis protein
LRDLGYVVLEADHATSALRLLDAHPEIGLLFTDVMLPQINGVRLAEDATRRRPGLPVLFTSGFAGDEPGEKSPLPPGAVLLRKPFTVQDLAEKIAATVQVAV